MVHLISRIHEFTQLTRPTVQYRGLHRATYHLPPPKKVRTVFHYRGDSQAHFN